MLAEGGGVWLPLVDLRPQPREAVGNYLLQRLLLVAAMLRARREIHGDRVEAYKLLDELDEVGLPLFNVCVEGHDRAGIRLVLERARTAMLLHGYP